MRGAVVSQMAGYEKTSGGNGRDMVAWRPCIWRFAAGYRRAGDFTWSARNRRCGQRAQRFGGFRRQYRRSERSERSRVSKMDGYEKMSRGIKNERRRSRKRAAPYIYS